MALSLQKAKTDLKLDPGEIEDLRERLRCRDLREDDYSRLERIFELVLRLQMLVNKRTSGILKLLRKMFGFKTEKIAKRRGQENKKDSSGNPCPPKKGRNGRNDYPGAQHVCIDHERNDGETCPLCHQGKLREAEPAVEYAWQGNPPITLTIFQLGRLICDLCKQVFTAKVPEDVPVKTVDDSADDLKVARCDRNGAANAMVVLMRFQYGVPNYRLAKIQGSSGIPLPEGTQNQMSLQVFASGLYIYEALIQEAAQGDLFHNDDTRMRITDVLGISRKLALRGEGSKVSTRTSVIIAKSEKGPEIALYFTGSALAGENLAWILSHRDASLATPKLMCDGLSHNHPKGYEVKLGNCLGHARRKFYDLNEKGHDLSQVLALFGQVYVNDMQAKINKLDDEKRLEFHKKHSTEVMKRLKEWMIDHKDKKKTEPNSELGRDIDYCLKRWDELTAFLREPGMPITNDLAEHMIKNPAVRHRKASLQYKTLDGALRGDVYMSLIATCESNQVNTLHYFTSIQEYRSDLIANPGLWLPWNYIARLNKLIEDIPPPKQLRENFFT